MTGCVTVSTNVAAQHSILVQWDSVMSMCRYLHYHSSGVRQYNIQCMTDNTTINPAEVCWLLTSSQINAEGDPQTLRQACYRENPESAMCVQNLDDSRGLAIRITYRISLRSSSLWEPRHPPLKVVNVSIGFRWVQVVLFQVSSNIITDNETPDTDTHTQPPLLQVFGFNSGYQSSHEKEVWL